VDQKLLISEIYLSVQGESTFTGLPCIFVRLTGCDLRCSFCDSAYAFTGGTSMPLSEIIEKIEGLGCSLIEITGGEPLLQKGVFPLMENLCQGGKTVLLETSGAHDISKVDPRVIRIVDMKCPSSGESDRNLLSNLQHLKLSDELKFVIGTREDFNWAREFVLKHELDKRVRSILFSPVFYTAAIPGQIAGHEGIDPRLLVEWILEAKLPVRFQLQIHKFIWSPTQKGV
jgi:7-carboxy-7-deazaguanine synthase